MTGDDLKGMQDNFLETSKAVLLEDGSHFRPLGFVITKPEHIERLFKSGWGVEFLGSRAATLGVRDDEKTAAIIIDLAMDWKRLYHAVLNVFPRTRDMLPGMITLGKSMGVDDVYKHTMRPFMQVTKLDEKDVIAAVMRQVCDKVEAFASIFHSEAWQRSIEPSETAEEIYKNAPKSLGQDAKSVEVLISSMETRDFTRMLIVPVQREVSPSSEQRDGGKVLGFGERTECLEEIEGRMTGFLKPLKKTP